MKSVLMAHLVSLPFILLTVTIVLVTMTTQQARGQLLQGSLAGNVTDSSQAAVAGAQVVATDQATSLSRQTITNSAGAYTMPVLPPGNYNVTVRSPGFQMYTQTGVAVTAQTVTRVDAVLEVGAVTENVTVSASAAAIQADRADVRSELGAKLLSTLPVPIGRNYQMVFTTIPLTDWIERRGSRKNRDLEGFWRRRNWRRFLKSSASWGPWPEPGSFG